MALDSPEHLRRAMPCSPSLPRSAVSTLITRSSPSLDEKLEQAGFPHVLRHFDGPHQWAPPEVMDEALAWFRLIAMKQNREARDDSFIALQKTEVVDPRPSSGPVRPVLRSLARIPPGHRNVRWAYRHCFAATGRGILGPTKSCTRRRKAREAGIPGTDPAHQPNIFRIGCLARQCRQRFG